MGHKKREAVLDIWQVVCGENRSQHRDTLYSMVAKAHTMPVSAVRQAALFLVEAGYIEISKGKRMTSDWWVRPTPLGKAKWRERDARRRHRAAP